MIDARKIPWPRILAEGIAIVISILLAFGIEAWWSNRQVLQNVQENLIALSDELHDNIRQVEHELSYRHAVIASIEKLFLSVDSANGLSPGEVDNLISDLTWDGRIDISTGALLNVLQSGVFTGIEDGELRKALAVLPTCTTIPR